MSEADNQDNLNHAPPDPQYAILHMLGRIEGKVDGLHNRIETNENNIKELTDRVTGLEKSKAWLLGAAAAVGAAVTYGFNYFLKKGGL